MHKHGGDIYSSTGLIDYSTNINPFGTPQGVVEAAIEGVLHSSNYPDVEQRVLREEIARHEHLPMEYVICGNGAAELIFSLVLAVKPRKALLLAPTFAEYQQALETVGCEIRYHLLDAAGGFQLDEKYLSDLTEEIDIIFLCNPNNPTGEVIDKELLEKILKRCMEHNIFMIMDECFHDFLDDPFRITMQEYVKNCLNIVILRAFTKLYAMAGLRLGYALCSNEELLRDMRQVTQPWNVSIPAQMAGVAALKEKEYVIESRKIIMAEKKYLIEALEEIGFIVYGSKANYIFFFSRIPLLDACKKHGYLIRDCSDYYNLEEGYYRISVHLHEENRLLIEVIQSIYKV